MKKTLYLAVLVLATSHSLAAQTSLNQAPSLKAVSFGEIRGVHAAGDLFLVGHVTQDDLSVIQAQGIRSVITLRSQGVKGWDTRPAVKRGGLAFVAVPCEVPEALTDAVFDTTRRLLRRRGRTLLHGGDASRVGGVWLAYRVLDQGVKLDAAIAEARTVGLRSPVMEKKARDYIQRILARTGGAISVKPGINDGFLDPGLSVERMVKRFEVESREIYSARREILGACGLKKGDRVADIGAGTGLFTHAFSKAVGDKGWVYAADIAPKFIGRINEIAVREKLDNVTGVVCTETSATLPPASVNVVFVCDTYHHFEYPQLTMASIHRALSPGGRFLIIDFERIPGKSRKWILGHMRAGKEVFRAEIEAAGFEFVAERKLRGLHENYFLEFRRKQ